MVKKLHDTWNLDGLNTILECYTKDNIDMADLTAFAEYINRYLFDKKHDRTSFNFNNMIKEIAPNVRDRSNRSLEKIDAECADLSIHEVPINPSILACYIRGKGVPINTEIVRKLRYKLLVKINELAQKFLTEVGVGNGVSTT